VELEDGAGDAFSLLGWGVGLFDMAEFIRPLAEGRYRFEQSQFDLYTSTFVEHRTPPKTPDPRALERRRRLRALVKADFPNGQFPDPYAMSGLRMRWQYGDNGLESLLFIRSSLTFNPDVDDVDPPVQMYSVHLVSCSQTTIFSCR
jgi:hypothetical protein